MADTYSSAWGEDGEPWRNEGWRPERGVQRGQQILAALARRVQDGSHERTRLRAPVGAEAAGHLAVDDRRAQRLLRGIVRRRDRRVREDDEEGSAMLPKADPQPTRFGPRHWRGPQRVAVRFDLAHGGRVRGAP